jgi:hypothetical protein
LDASLLVDLQNYPITDLEHFAARALIERCRFDLLKSGAVVMPGFLTREATASLAAEACGVRGSAHRYTVSHTVYFEPPDETFPSDHPRRVTGKTDKGNVPYDLIPADAKLRHLYQWDGLLNFVAAVLREPLLYRHADPMAALNINIHGPGQELGWHFDRTDLAVTLSLRQSEQGGVFEYVPDLRNDREENFERVARVLAGSDRDVRQLPAEPGTLILFRGRHSLHRVTPSGGPSERLMAALSFVREPNAMFGPYARELFYGRQAPIAVAA